MGRNGPTLRNDNRNQLHVSRPVDYNKNRKKIVNLKAREISNGSTRSLKVQYHAGYLRKRDTTTLEPSIAERAKASHYQRK